MPRRRRQSLKEDVEEIRSPTPAPSPPPSSRPRSTPGVVSTHTFDSQVLFNLQPQKSPIRVTYQDQFEYLTEVMRLHSKAWDAYLFSDSRLMDEFAEDVQQLREYFRCHICGDLVSNNPLLPMDKSLRHGTICRECLVNNRCRCVHRGCKLTLIGFYDDPVFSLMVKSYKKFCAMILFSVKGQKMLQRKVVKDHTFDATSIAVLLREGAFTGQRCLKKSIILMEPEPDDPDFQEPPNMEIILRNGVREANLRPNAELQITPMSGFTRSPTPCPVATKRSIVVSPSKSKKRAAPVIKLPPAKRWPEAAQALAYNAANSSYPSNPCMDANVYLGSNGYFSLGPVQGTSTGGTTNPTKEVSTAATTSSPPKGSTRTPQKEKNPAEPPPPAAKKSKSPQSPVKKDKDDQTKPTAKGCRCGNAAANPGKLTCCGQRCPCYVDGKGCFDCKCKGCRNPHLPGGKKLLQGINAVIDTRTNETVPYIPYITQFYSNSNNNYSGQLMQPVFPLTASVASFNSYGIPVISVSPIMHQQQQQQ